ncbi:CDP-alcohol phosphatidyltransferase family protein [Aquimarina sp. 2-A2]|uniref:CDP-alcohol phosphatidyltransferase family protein n=1 Tax=Aquimarina sp. 2-A2 TaxID=3382644 RepID=UPI00387EF2E9
MITYKNFTIADWLSIYRILAVPLLLICILFDYRELFSWFLLLSYSTDAADGFIARTLKISSPHGAQLDSYGDQLTFVMGAVGVLVFEFPFIMEHITFIIIVFIPYILQMLVALKKYGKVTAFHTYLAKVSAILQAIFILWTLFFEPVYWLFYVTIIVGLVETVEEIILIFMYHKWVTDVKGVYWAIEDERRTKKI